MMNDALIRAINKCEAAAREQREHGDFPRANLSLEELMAAELELSKYCEATDSLRLAGRSWDGAFGSLFRGCVIVREDL